MSIIKLPPYILDSTLDFTFNNVTATGNMSTLNANLGNVATANYIIGTLITSAQPNITSTGALANLTVSGNASFSGANVSLGTLSNLHIAGGAANYVISTDGDGNLTWKAQTGGGGGSLTLSGLTDTNISSPASGQVLVYDTASSKWLNTTVTPSSQLTMTDDTFAGDGTTTVYNLSVTPLSTLYTVVAIGGVVQPRSFYSLAGNVLTFSTAPPVSPVSVTTFSGNAAVIGSAISVTSNAQPNITSTGTLTSLTVSGNATFSSWTTLQQSSEVINTKTSATGTVAHDMSTGATFYHTAPSANFTANFTNVSTTDSRAIVAALIIVQGATPYVPTAVQIDGTAQAIKWLGSTVPTGTASKTDIISFSLIRTSSTWSVYGQYATYG